MEQFVNFVIRPPRADYSQQDLLEREFSLKGRIYQRKDLEITNSKGQLLHCSHYMPRPFPEDTQFPCVIYCHGNSGCRADGNEAAIVLLPSNITVFTIDFSGSGLSDGDYVTLGWNEKDDLKAVVSYLRTTKQVSCIGLWGRSMGAVTSILYGVEDPSIAGMVLDSPFSNLFDLMMELVDVYKIRLPKFTIKVALQIMRRIIQKRAQFDIMDLNVTQVSLKTFIPALFGHATEDLFIQPHHSDDIYKAYAGDKNIIKFEGDHNSPRPKFYYDSVTIFFHNVLHPPEAPVSDLSYDSMYFAPDALQMQEDFDEGLICNVVNEFQPSFSVPVISIPQSQHSDDTVVKHGVGSTSEVLQESCSESKINENNLLMGNSGQPTEVFELMRRAEGSGEPLESCSLESIMQKKGDCQIDDCFSYPSSNGASTESWGRCSSHGVSENSGDESPLRQSFADAPVNPDDEERMIMEAIAASLQDVSLKDAIEATTVQNVSSGTERTRKKKLESLSQRLKLSRLKGIGSIRKSTT